MAGTLDIFKQNAFGVTSMAAAMKEIKYVPGFISKMNIFQTTSIDTLDVAIEKDAEQNIFIVPSSPRGGVGKTFGKNGRTMRTLRVPHFEVNDAIMADEVQSVRAFSSNAVETFQSRIAMRGAEISQSFALTEEYHKLKVVTSGQLLDADGSVLYDYFTEFGEAAPTEIAFDLSAASPGNGVLRKAAATVTRAMAATLDGLTFSGIIALCGDAFFDDLIAHKEVTQTYLNQPAASTLRTSYVTNGQNGTFGAFEFGDIVWINYRGGQSVNINTDKCHFIPVGVAGLFRSVYAPADYNETVNKPGQRLYAKVWEMPNDKGMNLDYQSNVLHYCTRPRVLLKGRRGS